MSVRLLALRDFLKRYIAVWRNVWSVRAQLDPPERTENELAFLPAQLELTETPLSAAPKWTARLIMLFALIALLWALIGKIDIVAVAQGKTVPGGHSKTIQSLETAVVKRISVTNGQYVHTGQVLAELAGVGSDTDYVQSFEALQAAQLNTLRLQALLAALATQTPPLIGKSGSSTMGFGG